MDNLAQRVPPGDHNMLLTANSGAHPHNTTSSLDPYSLARFHQLKTPIQGQLIINQKIDLQGVLELISRPSAL